jgi:hypothetical protein
LSARSLSVEKSGKNGRVQLRLWKRLWESDKIEVGCVWQISHQPCTSGKLNLFPYRRLVVKNGGVALSNVATSMLSPSSVTDRQM